MNNYCYIHVCVISKGLFILKELLDMILKSDLYEQLICISIVLLGNVNNTIINNIERYDKKIKVIYTNENIRLYEYPTLKCLYDFSKEDNQHSNILYMHTKGVNKPYLKGEHAWRKYMSYFMITKSSNCLKQLKNSYDTVGCNLKKPNSNIKHLHYSGNFWWAKTDYIKTLIDPNLFLSDKKYYIEQNKIDRFHAEWWLMKNINVKPYCIYSIDRDIIKIPIEPYEYENGNDPYLLYLIHLKQNNIISKDKYNILFNTIIKYL